MTLCETSKRINCRELRATDRTSVGSWNLVCRKTGKRTTEEQCTKCAVRCPMVTEETPHE